jgi:hypothetical protein
VIDDDNEYRELKDRYEKMCADLAALPVMPGSAELRKRYLNFLAAPREVLSTKSGSVLFIPNLVAG